MSEASTQLSDQRDFVDSLQQKYNESNLPGLVSRLTDQVAPLIEPIAPELIPPVAAGKVPAAIQNPGPLYLQAPDLQIPSKGFFAPVLNAIPTIGDGLDVPIFDATYEKPKARTEPSPVAPFTATAPAIDTSFRFPAAPAFLNFLPPTLIERTLPTKGDTSVEKFSAVAPTDLPTAPADYTAKFKINYRDGGINAVSMADSIVDDQLAKINPQYATQMAAIESQLTKYLTGGTGLNADVEDAIYSRAREKMDVEAKRVQDAAYADAAARGFTLPTGALYSALARARQEAANNNAKSATDIAVAQAEMEQKNLQFAVTTSAALRKSMLDSTMSYMQSFVSLNGQALQFAKHMMDADIEVYNTAVKVFTLRLDQYKAESSVYELKSRISMNAIEIYKAELQAYSATLGADKNKIDIYRSLIEAHSTSASMYKTQVDAVVSQASLEKLKLEMHQLAVQTFSAEVQAKNAEWQGYQAAIEGDLAAVKVFSAEVQAFDGQVNAYKAQITADVEKAQGVAASNSALIQKFNAEVGVFDVELKANIAEFSGKIEVEKSKLVEYQGELQRDLANNQNEVAIYKTSSEINIENARQKLTAVLEARKIVTSAMQAAAGVIGDAVKVYSGPASAAASAMNGLASVNESI